MLSARSKTTVVAIFAFLLLGSSRPGYGQAITGDILGTVRDSSAAVVPGVKVTLTAMDTSVHWETTTDADGSYQFASLKPGRYSVQATKEGFETATVSNIDLLVTQRPRVDVTLQVGTVSQSIEVSAGGATQLETQTSQMDQVVGSTAVQDLPVVNRNFMSLVTLTAGVAPILNGNSPATYWTGAGASGSGNVTASVAGMRESNESFIVDGIESRNARFGSANLRPSFDAIQEVNVQTTSFSSEYGKSSAVINTTLKAGSNGWHGSAYDYFRNDKLNANDFFSNLDGIPKGRVRLNDFGFALGGPIRLPHIYNGRDKSFFFFAYEGLRNPTESNLQALDPSPQQLAGNLADNSYGTGFFPTSSPYCTSDPTSPHCVDVINPSTGQPFAGNSIPSAMLDSVAQKWLQFWPAPNLANAPIPAPGAFPVYNYAVNKRGYVNSDQYNARVDHTIGPNDQIWGAFTHDNRPTFSPGALPLSGASWPLSDTLLTLTETHTFSSNIVNEARFGYNRGRTYLVGEGALTQNYASSIFGFKNTSPNPFDFGVPDVGIPLFSGPGSPGESIGALDQDFQYVDNLSLVRGRHNLKLGINVIRELFSQVTDFSGIPSLNFSGRYTGNGLGDFLLGEPQSATASVGDSSQTLMSTFTAGFLQDNWRISPSLTLNLGVRYEYAQTPHDRTSKTGWFDPGTQQVEYSRSGAVRNGIVDPDWNNFAPRVGFAYTPSFNKNTVVRGAFGIFYGTDNWNELQFLVIQPDFYTTQTLNADPTKPTVSLENLFPPGVLGGGTTVPFSVDKRNRTPYIQEWNFDVQHTFPRNWFLDVGYLGNVGQKLPQRRNQDNPSFDPTGLVPIDQRVPYPAFSWILLTYNGGWSSYHGLVVRTEKRISNGMWFLGTYTWSHAIDVGNTDDFSFSQCCFKTIDKGNGDYNAQHRAVLSYVYELPFGHGKPLFSGISGAANKIVGGWQVSGITTFASGQFESASLPEDWQDFGAFSTSVPDKIGSAYTPKGQRTHSNWLNINSFTFPGCPSYVACTTTTGHVQGNSGRNQIEEPGINNWDLSLAKHTRITEQLNTEFRAEFYNAWNHTQFGPPSTGLTPGQFGVINGVLEGARAIQLAFRLSW